MGMAKRLQTRILKLKSLYVAQKLRLLGAKIGHNFLVFRRCTIYNAQNLKIGQQVFINDNFWCNAKGGVTIGDDTLIGPNVVIHSSNHVFSDQFVPIRSQGHIDAPVNIGTNVWLAAGCIILPGAVVPSGSVIAAGAVVNRPLERPGVYGGVPAACIREFKANKDYSQ